MRLHHCLLGFPTLLHSFAAFLLGFGNAVFQIFYHTVQGSSQHADLIFCRNDKPAGEIAPSNLFRVRGGPPQRTGNGPSHENAYAYQKQPKPRAGQQKRGFTSHFTTVYSEERLPRHEEIAVACGSGLCLCSKQGTEWCSSKKVINGSAVTVTATAGMILASLVVQSVYAQNPHPTACDDPTLP